MAGYRRRIQNNPDNATAYNNIGSLLVVQGQAQEGIAIYQQAIRRLPNDSTAYYNLGVTLYNQGELAQADKRLKQAQKKFQGQGKTQKAETIEHIIKYIAYIQQQPSSPIQTAALPTEPTPENDSPENNTQVSTPDSHESEIIEFSIQQTETPLESPEETFINN
ncbi:MAG: tetratricopeptide repeat protein [Richelia sp.]|nr:tetratricopeptide repeat protein [Richelia sp.]